MWEKITATLYLESFLRIFQNVLNKPNIMGQ